MKKIAIFAAVFAFILLLTKIANQVPPEPPSGTAFSLKAQQVVQCSPDEITLVDNASEADAPGERLQLAGLFRLSERRRAGFLSFPRRKDHVPEL